MFLERYQHPGVIIVRIVLLLLIVLVVLFIQILLCAFPLSPTLCIDFFLFAITTNTTNIMKPQTILYQVFVPVQRYHLRAESNKHNIMSFFQLIGHWLLKIPVPLFI